MRILIVDDNKQITDVLKTFASKEGMEVEVAYDGEEAWAKYQKGDFHIILLDIMMPKLDGYELLKRIRKESNIPVILITAKGDDYEKIMGLDYGADDYIVKPFSVAEVMARVRAVLRRVQTASSTKSSIEIGSLQLDLNRFTCQINQTDIELTKREFELLWLLANYPQKVFTRDNILDSLWGEDYFGDTRIVDTHIKRMRAKIDRESHPDWEVATVHGLGYKFEVLA